MAANTPIEWTARRHPVTGKWYAGATFNPWQGCVKISPACTHCYAATFAKRFGVEWGPHARRKFQSEEYWQQPHAWNRKAERLGMQLAVFCASMSDVFEYLPESHPDHGQMCDERGRLWALIEETPHLDWLLLTKRPENITPVVPDKWLEGFPENVWVGATVEDQKHAEERIPALLQVPSKVRFLSCEPLLGPVNLRALSGCTNSECWNGCMPAGISWVISGGESGHGARPSHPDWFRSLRDQCQAAGVPFHFKQWGAHVGGDALELIDGRAGWCRYQNGWMSPNRTHEFGPERVALKVGKSEAGRVLDGRTWDEVPR